jgi:subtilisin family serine protease
MKRAVFLGFALAAALGLASASWAQKPPSTLSNLSVSPFEALPKGLQKAELLAREAALDLSEVVGLGKIDAAFLKTAVRADSIDVLVEFHATTKQTDYQAIKKKVVQAMGVQGIRIIQEYNTLPMSYLRINGSAALLKLLKHSNVKRIHQNQKYKPSLLQSLPLIKHPEAMRVELAPPPDRGSGSNQGANTVVAILDSGIDGLQPEFGNYPESVT